ncbi:MAG: GH32 C-terminal domain-containing protein [Planctomycetes bacterium]|nr:GH32 C-terminal domain-containing protein [Planctomycetota bacterium]
MRVQLFVCGTVAEVFVDNRVALVTRMYNHRDGGLALFVEDGEASFESLTLKALP